MNREETKEAIKVMQAYVDGKTIESRKLLRSGYWSAVQADNTQSTPMWDWFECRYRIKPEPREWYEVEVDGVTDHLEHHYKRFSSADEASAEATKYGYVFGEFRVVKVREVL